MIQIDNQGWQCVWHYKHDFYREFGWRRLDVGLIRIHTPPPAGGFVTRQNYQGFLLTIRVWLPWVIQW